MAFVSVFQSTLSPFCGKDSAAAQGLESELACPRETMEEAHYGCQATSGYRPYLHKPKEAPGKLRGKGGRITELLQALYYS